MFQFVVDGGAGEAAYLVVCAKIPFTIGREQSSNLQLTAPGVWDLHAEVYEDCAAEKFAIRPLGEALLLVNGERSSGTILRPGDQINIGAAALMVSLSPVRQKRIGAAEAWVWALLLAATFLETFLLVSLK